MSRRDGDDADGEPGRRGRDGSDGNGTGGDQSPGGGRDDGVGTVEKAVMVVSLTFTLLLFAYAGWKIAAVPGGGTPNATVVGTRTLEDGNVAVEVRIRNPSNVGLLTATVELDCTSPPTSLQFTYVPADATRRGTVVCPTGSSSPTVSVVSWKQV